jgi:hypothetical protein
MSNTIEASPPGVSIPGYEPLSGATISGKAALIFGLGLCAVAGGLCWLAWGDLPFSIEKPSVSPMTMASIALGIFGLCGVYLFLRGAVDVYQDNRRDARKVQHPQQPWQWDYLWNEYETTDLGLRTAVRGVVATLLTIGFLIPFHVLIFTEKLPWFALAGMVFFDVVMLLVAGTVGYRILSVLVHGRSRLRYASFPLRLGKSARFTLVPSGRLDDIPSLRCTLRCVEERIETRGTGKQRRTIVVGYARYAAEQEIENFALQGGGGVEIEFELPDDDGALRSRLSDRPPQYWELVVEGKRPGIDYNKRFLLPVY